MAMTRGLWVTMWAVRQQLGSRKPIRYCPTKTSCC